VEWVGWVERGERGEGGIGVASAAMAAGLWVRVSRDCSGLLLLLVVVGVFRVAAAAAGVAGFDLVSAKLLGSWVVAGAFEGFVTLWYKRNTHGS
jgi:hypothetical protein